MKKIQLLILGYSSFVKRRVLPAIKKIQKIEYFICSKSNKINLKEIIFILKDHGDGQKDNISQSFLDTRTICTHYPDPESDGNTAASLVSELHSDNSQLDIHWTSMYSPCLGIFIPMFIEGEIPKILSIGNKNYDLESPWWSFRSIEELCRTEGILDNKKASEIRKIWEPIQNEFYKSAKLIARDANKLKQENKLSAIQLPILEPTKIKLLFFGSDSKTITKL